MMCALFITAALFSQTEQIENGSLLFVANGNNIVQTHTNSTLTHVGVVLNNNGDPWFYDAIPPKVRKIKLADYIEEIKKENNKKKAKVKLIVWIARPDHPLNQTEYKIMKKYLESQIGKPYSIDSFVLGAPGNGVHCCEMTGKAFEVIDRSYTANPGADSPVSVWKKTKDFFPKREEINLD